MKLSSLVVVGAACGSLLNASVTTAKGTIKTKLIFLLAVLIGAAFTADLHAQGTAFTQGRLSKNGEPANGAYALQFSLFDAPARPCASVLALGVFCAAIGAYSTRGAANVVPNVTLNTPYGLAIGPDGTLYFADSSNYRIRLEP